LKTTSVGFRLTLNVHLITSNGVLGYNFSVNVIYTLEKWWVNSISVLGLLVEVTH